MFYGFNFELWIWLKSYSFIMKFSCLKKIQTAYKGLGSKTRLMQLFKSVIRLQSWAVILEKQLWCISFHRAYMAYMTYITFILIELIGA